MQLVFILYSQLFLLRLKLNLSKLMNVFFTDPLKFLLPEDYFSSPASKPSMAGWGSAACMNAE